MSSTAPRPSAAHPVRAGLAACLGTIATRRVLDAVVPAHDPRWTRTNHRGEPISLLEGPSVAAGLVAGAVAGGGGRSALAGALAAAGGAALGLVDDLSEDTDRRRKGLRGHLGAMVHGELTTGGLKVLGIGATSTLAAAVATPTDGRRAVSWTLDVVASGALVAATANLVNLLDLRPGRALKAASLGALPALVASASPASAACVGASVAAAGRDLGERDMLGDGGANALGALLGASVVLSAPRPVRLLALAGAVALTVASERVSFTEVIARTPALRRADAWGRRA